MLIGPIVLALKWSLWVANGTQWHVPVVTSHLELFSSENITKLKMVWFEQTRDFYDGSLDDIDLPKLYDFR